MTGAIRCKELAQSHFRGSLGNHSDSMMCYMFKGLTKNLNSVSTLQDKGYEVTFRKGKVSIMLSHENIYEFRQKMWF
jgi:hypothetical protein